MAYEINGGQGRFVTISANPTVAINKAIEALEQAKKEIREMIDARRDTGRSEDAIHIEDTISLIDELIEKYKRQYR
jgi:hypothetical protein